MTMAHSIGQLGTPRPPIELSFQYFGVVVRVHPDASDLELVDFMMSASGIDEADTVHAMHALGRYLKGLVHPDDWDTFWAAAKANRQQLPDLMQTAQSIVEAVAGFPTGQPSGSSSGQSTTGPRSKDGSSSQAVPETRRALRLLADRPDLQAVVVDAAEARALAG